MSIHHVRKIFYVVLFSILLLSCGVPSNSPATQSTIISESIANVVVQYRQEIQQRIKRDSFPGLAIAIVDDKGVLWQEGFGYTDWDSRTPVTPSTLFSIQSMSKSFTATAAMFAAQDGLVDLDEPITTYLPDFHVNSIFEENPEQKITLRILLSHTAGFAHEAPYGGNYSHPAYSFEKHISSISDTWLMFPVGTRYSYSNLGIDLAGYILQVHSGKPFIQYIQEKVLDPLGMKDSTLDVSRVRANRTRAIGHIDLPLRPPVDFLLIPSGGVWTTAADMARYLQFHINKGELDGSRLLRESLAETMYTPPNFPANHMALGIVVDTRNGVRHFQHGGGGFGFNSSMVWYPELKLGSVVLINKPQEDSFVVSLSENVLDSIIVNKAGLYADRAASAVQIEPAYLPSTENIVLSDQGLQAKIESMALPLDEAAQKRGSTYAGKYRIFFGESVEISNFAGRLAYTYDDSINFLTEVAPGLYFSPAGDSFDFRGPVPMFKNIRLYKVDSKGLSFLIAFLTICGLIFLSALFFVPASAYIKKNRQKGMSIDKSTIRSRKNGWLIWARILAALASFFSLLGLALVALLPELVIIPWPRPYVDLLWWQYALLSLPFAALALVLGIALLVGLAVRNHESGRATYTFYSLVALALLGFNIILLI